MADPPTIDIDLLRDELADRQPLPGHRRVLWMMRRFATIFVGFYVPVFALPALLSGSWRRAFAGVVLWTELALSLLFAATMTALSMRGSRASPEARLQRSARSLERGWVQMTQGHWVLRVLLMGIAMGAAIGLSVGTLLAVKSPHDDLLAGSRLLTGLAFSGMTFAWCIPMAFVIRWLYLRWARQFIVGA